MRILFHFLYPLFFFGALSLQAADSRLVLPPVIYLAEQVESRIYYDNVIHCKGTYNIEVACPIGVIGDEFWSFVPQASDEGVYPFSMTIFDDSGIEVASSDTVLAVMPQVGSSEELRIMAIGDSLTAPGQYLAQLAQRMESADISYATMGTVSRNGLQFEGYGGNTFSRYLEGPHYFRSPFVYSDTGFDPKRYFNENTGGVVPTLILVFLGINDTFSSSNATAVQQEGTLEEVVAKAEAFINGMRAAAPLANVGIILTPAASADQQAYDTAYGEGIYLAERWHATRLELVRRYIEAFGQREDEGIFLVPVSTGLDRLADYSASDPIHPQKSGYNSIGDMIFGWLTYYLQEDSYPRWALQSLKRETIQAGAGHQSANPDQDWCDNWGEYIFGLDPEAPSASPLLISPQGLTFRYRDGAKVYLEFSSNSRDWEMLNAPSNQSRKNGFRHLSIPIEFENEQFFRVRYDSK
jgi:lysophospholipase L1-like esterase